MSSHVRPLPAHAAEVLPVWGARLSTPQKASASLGVVICRAEMTDAESSGTQIPKGLLIQVEPGLGGGKASLGYAMGLLPHIGGGIKASYLRTWDRPFHTEPKASYLGIEADFTIFIKCSLGVLRRVDGHPRAARTLLTGGIGFGF